MSRIASLKLCFSYYYYQVFYNSIVITQINLVNFRSYKKQIFEFGNETVIVGDNGAGKTNILEAIYMTATGKSFRADKDSELISYGGQFASIRCDVSDVQLRIFIDDKKRFEVNGVTRRMMDFVGNLKAVKFGPEDIEIITGSTSGRRKYLDMVISQKDREYRRCAVSYEKGLRQRNKLLDLIRDGVANRSQLFFWDKLLIKDGSYLTEKREEYLSGFNLQSSIFNTQYDKSVISEVRLLQYEKEEVAAGNTLVGPHRDDFVVNMGDKDISKYGSRGQQRMAVLALKMWELQFLTSFQLPVLLLDDVYSELDHLHRTDVLKLANGHAQKGGQVIMTTSDENLIPVKWNIIKIGKHD